MRICRKCATQVSDDKKICRNCGAILEDIQDEVEPVATVEPVTSDEESVGDVVDSEPFPPPDLDAPPWKCPRCGENVPGTFDICWKCQAIRGEEQNDDEPAIPEEDLATRKSDEELAPTELDAVPSRMKKGSTKAGKRHPPVVCPRCGSAKMVLRAKVCTWVVIDGNPSALASRSQHEARLVSNICGDCGHVELRVKDPRELYRLYRQSRR